MKKTRIAYGDFQTPLELSREIVSLLRQLDIEPATVVEPTCGLGSFLVAAAECFDLNCDYHGFDINPEYVSYTSARLSEIDIAVQCQDFFAKDWREFFKSSKKPILVVGNPPWVTNATLGAIGSNNLPKKSNFQGHTGFSAKTGRANFDISEWMLIKLVEALLGLPATIAMLCKTATARKVLQHCWKHDLAPTAASMQLIDAKRHFGVSVDACLFLVSLDGVRRSRQASVFSDLSRRVKLADIGIINGDLVADVDAYARLKDIDGIEYRKWRSGVKHDASKVMEFRCRDPFLENGLGEIVDLEDEYLYPLLKSSDVANDRLMPKKKVLVTQQKITEDTIRIRSTAPKTWAYLESHSEALDRRKSIIYEKRARFSVFGVGDYTFAPWKICISGLYKNLAFRVVGPHEGKPIVLDDTCYFLPFQEQDEATFFGSLLRSDKAIEFIHSLVFFDAKRPVTLDVLKRIDLRKLASTLGVEERARYYLPNEAFEKREQQQFVFDRPDRLES